MLYILDVSEHQPCLPEHSICHARNVEMVMESLSEGTPPTITIHVIEDGEHERDMSTNTRRLLNPTTARPLEATRYTPASWAVSV